MNTYAYIIRRRAEPCYLMNWLNTGVTEVDEEGRRQTVYTFLWGNRLHDAKQFIDLKDARKIEQRIRERCEITTIVGAMETAQEH